MHINLKISSNTSFNFNKSQRGLQMVNSAELEEKLIKLGEEELEEIKKMINNLENKKIEE